jgi:hypothetical protein
LKGVATFSLSHPPPRQDNNGVDDDGEKSAILPEMVYKEQGETAAPGLRGVGGMRWTKKYIWRLVAGDGIEVWFVKLPGGVLGMSAAGDKDERDYIFHELRFDDGGNDGQDGMSSDDEKLAEEIDFPLSLQENFPNGEDGGDFTTLTARGDHLCVNDMYHTTYSFRLRGEGSSAEVVCWASRHVVRGPKKRQVIVNVYDRE